MILTNNDINDIVMKCIYKSRTIRNSMQKEVHMNVQ